ncbi:MAG: hypothetical protein EAZ99_07840 [Alphaproteobacteria bacterium]|nr:MAG: hypothetical protein EAZ99_07840 [Alphaproteobacteria bacterium]
MNTFTTRSPLPHASSGYTAGRGAWLWPEPPHPESSYFLAYDAEADPDLFVVERGCAHPAVPKIAVDPAARTVSRWCGPTRVDLLATEIG